MANFGYIRVATATPSVRVADCDYNTTEIINVIEQAEAKGVSVIVFPELSITAYTCGDLFQQQSLLKACEESVKKINSILINKNIIAIIGLPLPVGNKLYNAAAVLSKGRIEGFVPKVYLPNYSEFMEQRWFTPADELIVDSVNYAGQTAPIGENLLFKIQDTCFGIELCEDLWTTIPPSSLLSLHGAELIFNLSASSETVGKNNYRKQLLAQQSARCFGAYVYSSTGCGESTTDCVFSGCSMIANNGKIVAEVERFRMESQFVIADIDYEALRSARMQNTSYINSKHNFEIKKAYKFIEIEHEASEITQLCHKINPTPFIPSTEELMNDRCGDIFNIQISGLAKRLYHIKAKTAVIGISGGLDSTLALMVLVATFDQLGLSRKGIYGITMPGFGTTDRTYNNAIALMKALDITIKEIPISKAVLQHFEDIEHDPSQRDVTYENAQARERTQILMDYANKINGIVIGTGDLSELALGWCTYNGDHMSMYGVNAGVPKTLVRTLTKWISDNKVDENTRAILCDVIDTPVSPELLPADENGQIAQKTEDSVGPYILHDFFLYHVLHAGFSPAKVYFLAQQAFKDNFTDAEILRWLRTFYWRFFSQQFKRSCMPDGPKIGSICLSPRGDWKMPSDACANLWLNDIEKLK